MSARYTIGLDFGTLSVRALAVDASDGRVAGECLFEYPHGVMSEALPDGTALPDNFALAHPQDYLDALYTVIPELIKKTGIAPEHVCGIGLDVTSPTPIPLDKNGEPLALRRDFASSPHAYIKLWKHHGEAGLWAAKLDAAAKDSDWLPYYGGSVNCEFIIPKALETQHRAPEVWAACECFCEVGDWLCRELCGTRLGSSMMASSNALFFRGEYPSDEIFRSIAPDKAPITRKLISPLLKTGACAGSLRPEAAARLGLPEGIAVAPALIDSHASVIGCGADRVGDLVAVLGTSACYLLNGKSEAPVPGSCCAGWGINAPDRYGFESGQTCFGDGLSWVAETCAPASLHAEAEARQLGIHALLQEKCADYLPGGSGLAVLDWWNGVRSPLKRPELSAVIAGLTLRTRPEDIYHAAMEALCFGARRIVNAYLDAGQPVTRLIATGGIARKSPGLTQMLADALRLPVLVCESTQTGALGSAIAAAAAAENRPLSELMQSMSSPACGVFEPRLEYAKQYDSLYLNYLRLSDFFTSQRGI